MNPEKSFIQPNKSAIFSEKSFVRVNEVLEKGNNGEERPLVK